MNSNAPTFKRPFSVRTALLTLWGLISLMRPLNAVITLLAIVAAGFIAGVTSEMLPVLLLAAAAGGLLGSAGNVINDVYDVQIDKINKPRRAIAAGIVSRNAAVRWGIVCLIAGGALSWLVGPPAFLIALASIALMILYSTHLKRYPIVGNVAVGLLTGAAFLFGGVAVGNPSAGIVPALFACFFNIAREILKDVEDIEGDKAGRVRTFPLLFGVEYSLYLATALFLLIIVGTWVPYLLGLYNVWYLAVVVAGVDVVLLAVVWSMWRSPTKRTIGRLCTVLKYDMLVGIFAILIGVKG